jgi:membrane protease subunit HflK
MAAKPRNPFEHHHDHGHDHDHDHDHDHSHEREELLDPAQRSLSDALKVSFSLLQIVMLIMVVVYLFSGVFNVSSQEAAVRLRLGQFVEREPGRIIHEPGGPYWAFPVPFEEVIRIPISQRSVNLTNQFWFQVTAEDAGKTMDQQAQGKMGPLNPEKDGSLLTGDANIVHARWSVVYSVTEPDAYVRKVGDVNLADQLVRNAAEEAVVHAVAQLKADDLIGGGGGFDVARERAKTLMNQTLKEIGCGITVGNVSAERAVMPMAVRAAYHAVLSAESEKLQQIEEAQQERSKVLGEAAGEAYAPLLKLIDDYEEAVEVSKDAAKIASVEAAIDTAFRELTVAQVPIGGEVSKVISEAQTYRTQIVERVKGDARTFDLLLPQYKATPNIVLSRTWQQAKEQVLTDKNVEKFMLPAGQVYLEMNRDPAIAREREKERLTREREERARAGAAGR